MTETTSLRAFLLPELEDEFAMTRKLFEALPVTCPDYKPHDKSFSMARLAGHIAEMPWFLSITLTSPDMDLSMQPYQKRLLYETKPQLLAEFNVMASQAITDLKNASDQVLQQNWTLSFKGRIIFGGPRYQAYRQFALNHMIHHRAQLGVYLRLLNLPVPGIYGPSADEPFAA